MNTFEMNYNSESRLISLNPLNAFISDKSGALGIKRELHGSKISMEQFKSNLQKHLESYNNNELFIKVLHFIEIFNKKSILLPEVIVYLNNLIINNYSLINYEIINRILDKFLEMLDTSYGEHIQNSYNLVVSCLSDISVPSSISQEEYDTCAVTCIQSQLSVREPLKYLDIIDNLAKNENYVTRKGKEIKPCWNNTNEKDSRRISSKIFQNSLTGFISEISHSYRKHKNKGLLPEEILEIYENLFDSHYKIYSISDYTPDDLFKILINANPSGNNPVQLSLYYEENTIHALHAMNAININKQYHDITLVNPWGREETVCIDLLKTRINYIVGEITLDKNIQRVPEKYFQEIQNKLLLNIKKKFFYYFPKVSTWNLVFNLNIQQKASLIISIYLGKSGKQKKLILLRILDNILYGSNYQNNYIIFSLLHEFSENNLDFFSFIEYLKSQNDIFDKVISKITTSVKEWEELFSDDYEFMEFAS